MRQMMEGVVHRHRHEGAAAGDTGAEKPARRKSSTSPPSTTRTPTTDRFSVAPLTNPAIVVVVTLNGTHGTAGFGGAAAAPVSANRLSPGAGGAQEPTRARNASSPWVTPVLVGMSLVGPVSPVEPGAAVSAAA